MIDPWIALGTNMMLLGALGALIQYGQRDLFRMPATASYYVAHAFILTLAAGCAAMLAWGLTRAWA